MGGCKTYGGRKTYQRTRSLNPSKRVSGLLCRGFLYKEEQRTDTWGGGGKRTVRGGSKPPFGEGCQSWGFPPPSFFHPSMASSEGKSSKIPFITSSSLLPWKLPCKGMFILSSYLRLARLCLTYRPQWCLGLRKRWHPNISETPEHWCDPESDSEVTLFANLEVPQDATTLQEKATFGFAVESLSDLSQISQLSHFQGHLIVFGNFQELHTHPNLNQHHHSTYPYHSTWRNH